MEKTKDWSKMFLRVAMPNGSFWDVPVMVIANNRANAYKHQFGDDLQRSLEEDTLQLFEQDDYNIEDWAANNMSWADVKECAVEVHPPPQEVDWEDGWMNGEKEIVVK